VPAAPSAPELLKRLHGKARRGPRAVDVEDLLPLAALRDPAAAAQLRALAAGWARRGRTPGSAAREVPLGRWADHVCAALEGGPAAVVELARTDEGRRLDAEDGFGEASIALSVLAAVRTEESVRAVLALAADALADLDARRALAVGCASALNDLTAFKDPVRPSDEVAAEARAFLHALAARPLSSAEVATACLALRGVGDESSLELVKRLPELPRPWEKTADWTARAIRARLRARAGQA
jgi:hypothetical protein